MRDDPPRPSDDPAAPAPEPGLARLARGLREDPAFRTTFLAAVVLPALCALGVVSWIVLAVARG